MELKSYTGNILYVDLSASKVNIRNLNEEWTKKFIGGSGLGVKYL